MPLLGQSLPETVSASDAQRVDVDWDRAPGLTERMRASEEAAKRGDTDAAARTLGFERKDPQARLRAQREASGRAAADPPPLSGPSHLGEQPQERIDHERTADPQREPDAQRARVLAHPGLAASEGHVGAISREDHDADRH